MNNKDGSATTYFFDFANRTIATQKIDGGKTQQAWNAAGHVESTTDELGFLTQFAYDENGNVTWIKRPGENVGTLITYDQTFNVPTLVTPATGAATTFSLDPATGEVLQKSRTANSTTLSLTFTRDAFGNLLSTDNGRATYADQRNSDGLLTQKYDLHNSETTTYDSRSRVATRTFQSGRVLTYGYDDYDRVISVTDSAGPTVLNEYDAMGRLLKKTVTDGAKPQVTTYTWDDQDRLVTETDALGRVTRYGYEKHRVLTKPKTITDPAGRITRFEYDQLGRLTKKTDPRGAATTYEYTLRGDLASVTDALGNVTSYEYDGKGRKVVEKRPSVQGTTPVVAEIHYAYDDLDRVTVEEHLSSSGNGSRYILFEYDAFDRLSKKTLSAPAMPNEVTNFTYENQLDVDLLKSAINETVNLGFTRESSPPYLTSSYTQAAVEGGNPKNLIEGEYTITRDATGNIASVASTAGTIYSKTYDAAGRLLSANAGALQTALAYDNFGRKVSIAHSTGEVGLTGYDALNRVTQMNWKEGLKNSVQEFLRYDVAGNITGIARENARYELGYDEADQLVSSKYKGQNGVPSYNRSFGYDLVGNRVNDSIAGLGVFQSNFLTNNGVSTFEADSDGRGEVVRENTGDKTKSYTYRGDGKINTFSDGSTQATYYYDGLDRLIAKAISANGTQFTQSFVNLASENRVLLGKAGDGSVTTYIDGQGAAEHLGEVKGGVGRGYITDHLGSVLNSSLAGFGRAYGLYGELASEVKISAASSPVVYGFTGHSVDLESGLNRTDYRQYDSKVGRWLSQDPIGLDGGDENYYRYVSNRPSLYVDTTGLFFEDFIARHTSAGMQAAIGTGAALVGVGLVKAGIAVGSTVVGAGLGGASIVLGAFLAIEGGANVIKSVNRGVLNQLESSVENKFKANQAYASPVNPNKLNSNSNGNSCP